MNRGKVCISLNITILSLIMAIPTLPVSIYSIPVLSDNEGSEITELWDGYRLNCSPRDIKAEVKVQGVKMYSTSSKKSGGVFSVAVSRPSRNPSIRVPASDPVLVKRTGQIIRCCRKEIIEEYRCSNGGIQLDFVIDSPPMGPAKMMLDLAFTGAKVINDKDAREAGKRIEMQLKDGRMMCEHVLQVTDVAGKALGFLVERRNKGMATIIIDDGAARYPVRIQTVITDAHWVPLKQPERIEYAHDKSYALGMGSMKLVKKHNGKSGSVHNGTSSSRMIRGNGSLKEKHTIQMCSVTEPPVGSDIVVNNDESVTGKFSCKVRDRVVFVRLASVTNVNFNILTNAGDRVYQTNVMVKGEYAFQVPKSLLVKGSYIVQVDMGKASMRCRIESEST